MEIGNSKMGNVVGGRVGSARVQSLRLACLEGLVGDKRRDAASTLGLVGRAGLNWAGPAGWLRESGSRLPQSKAFGWLVRRGRGGLGGLVGALRAQREL